MTIKQIQKTKPQAIESFIKVLSGERLSSYRRTADSTDIDAIAVCAWNMDICASLYPILQVVEVCLRNSIHQAMCEYYNDVSWFKNPNIIALREIESVNRTIKNLKEIHRSTDPNHMISELNFGFWTNLFNREYERVIWHRLIKKIFPNAPRHVRTRHLINQKLINIRKLRNRVFHHQRVWNISDLSKQKNSIEEVIGWINKEALDFIKIVDNFDAVYNPGIEKYEKKCKEIFS